MPTNQPKREPSADKHASSKRVVVPTSEMSEIDNSLNAKEKRNLDPKGKEGAKLRKENGFHLNWDRAGDLDELPSWVKTIFIHEKILPQALINSVSRNASEGENQGKLFDANFNGIDAEKRWLFWEHEANWSNRLIHGNSIEVMTSLLEREKREGQVQCLFFDPPFGIDFKGLVANKGGGAILAMMARVRGPLRTNTSEKTRTEPQQRVLLHSLMEYIVIFAWLEDCLLNQEVFSYRSVRLMSIEFRC